MSGLPAALVVAALPTLVGPLQGSMAELLESLPPVASPVGVATYGGAVVAILGAGHAVWRWGRSSSGGSVAHVGRTTGRTVRSAASTRASHGGSTKSGVAFTLPGFLPVSEGIRSVSHDEIHALELGIVVGVIVGWLFSTGRQGAATGLALTFVGASLGYKRLQSKAVKTVGAEPWYALLSFALGVAVGFLGFTKDLPF